MQFVDLKIAEYRRTKAIKWSSFTQIRYINYRRNCRVFQKLKTINFCIYLKLVEELAAKTFHWKKIAGSIRLIQWNPVKEPPIDRSVKRVELLACSSNGLHFWVCGAFRSIFVRARRLKSLKLRPIGLLNRVKAITHLNFYTVQFNPQECYNWQQLANLREFGRCSTATVIVAFRSMI